MSTRNLVLLLIPLVLLAGLLLALETPVSEPADSSVSSGVVYDPDVDQAVRAFGDRLQQVSLLAPSESLRAEMQAAYGAFVAPELLDAWVADPARALGRQTSSPWPDRIQVGSMQQQPDGSFIVYGTVVEVVTNGAGDEEIVGTYPVELRLEKRGSAWMIASAERGPYANIPARTVVVGTFTCLPHRDTSGPQTLECAFGVQEEGTGDHYAVDTMLMSSTGWQNIPSGARVRVEGVKTPIELLSTDHWRTYDILGIISATTIQEL